MINCLVGLSRSATVLIAALMILRHWTLAHAFRALRLRRQVLTLWKYECISVKYGLFGGRKFNGSIKIPKLISLRTTLLYTDVQDFLLR